MGRAPVAMRVVLFALAFVALACGAAHGFEDDGDVELSLPVDDKHFLDYVVALVDEFAPDDYSDAKEQKNEMARIEKRDQKAVTDQQADLDKAKQALEQSKGEAAKTEAAMQASLKKEQDEQTVVDRRKSTAAADAKKTKDDAKKVAADKKAMKKDKQQQKADESKLRKEQSKLDKDKKSADDVKQKHETVASKVIDSKASVDKAQLRLTDKKSELTQAKADEKSAAAATKEHKAGKAGHSYDKP